MAHGGRTLRRWRALLFLGLLAGPAGAYELDRQAAFARAFQQTRHVHSCYYAHLHARSLLNPALTRFLHDEYARLPFHLDTTVDPEVGLTARHLRAAIEHFNAVLSRPASHVVFRPRDFDRLIGLHTADQERSPAGLQRRDLAWLVAWMAIEVNTPAEPTAVSAPLPLSKLIAGEPYRSALTQTLASLVDDPVGRRLLDNAVRRGIRITVQDVFGYAAYFDPGRHLITVDKTVLLDPFKLNYLVHELVHAANPRADNSLTEEVLAEIIATQMQDRLTGVGLACHPYYVLVDRLLSVAYAYLPVSNAIVEDLRQLGVRVAIRR